MRETLDFKEIEGPSVSRLGQQPFDQRMMVALLLHGYRVALFVAADCQSLPRAERFRDDCRADPPDFRTISDFRKRHIKALGALFLQVLKLCEAAGLFKLGHVALDGTKIKANASKHKAMSYQRMKKRESELKAEVARMLAAAEAADAQQPKLSAKTSVVTRCRIGPAQGETAGEDPGAMRRWRPTPSWPRRKSAASRPKKKAARRCRPQKPGKQAAPPSDEPDHKAQRNFTDPEAAS